MAIPWKLPFDRNWKNWRTPKSRQAKSVPEWGCSRRVEANVRPVERSTAADSILQSNSTMACGHPGRRRPGLHEQLHKFAAIFFAATKAWIQPRRPSSKLRFAEHTLLAR